MRTEAEWIELGKKRIISILTKYIACTPSQLEIKIAEAGPINQRVEPVLLTRARRQLLNQEKIQSRHAPGGLEFVFLPNTDGRSVTPRINRISGIHDTYARYCNKPLCGFVLEYIVQKAIRTAGTFDFVADILEDTPEGIIQRRKGSTDLLNGVLLPDGASLDIIAHHKGSGIPVGIEIKNRRTWKYGDDCEIWQCIAKCTTLGIMPIFVNRKISPLAQFMFAKIGMLSMESQFQFFHPSLSNSVADIVHKELLGFADIKCSVEPLPYMVDHFGTVIPTHIERYYETFQANIELLRYFAFDCNLANENCTGNDRHVAYTEFQRDIGLLR